MGFKKNNPGCGAAGGCTCDNFGCVKCAKDCSSQRRLKLSIDGVYGSIEYCNCGVMNTGPWCLDWFVPDDTDGRHCTWKIRLTDPLIICDPPGGGTDLGSGWVEIMVTIERWGTEAVPHTTITVAFSDKFTATEHEYADFYTYTLSRWLECGESVVVPYSSRLSGYGLTGCHYDFGSYTYDITIQLFSCDGDEDGDCPPPGTTTTTTTTTSTTTTTTTPTTTPLPNDYDPCPGHTGCTLRCSDASLTWVALAGDCGGLENVDPNSTCICVGVFGQRVHTPCSTAFEEMSGICYARPTTTSH